LSHTLVLFANDTETMVAGKALRDAGVFNKIVAKPAGIETNAHMCLEIKPDEELKARNVLSSRQMACDVLLR
jgi:hypothetical protein